MKRPTEYYDYDYLPVGSIRLLKLHGIEKAKTEEEAQDVRVVESREEQLVVSLHTFEISKCPDYMALSYTWGLPGSLDDPESVPFTQVERVYPIYCEDEILRGTWNLREALRYIRWELKLRENECWTKKFVDVSTIHQAMDKCVYLWVDALCINQDSNEDRATQVACMGEIYRRAKRTLIWLGGLDRYTDEAFEVLRKVAENVHEAVGRYKSQPSDQVAIQQVSLTAEQIRACIALLNRKWFQRAWIVQEVMLSKAPFVLIGGKIISFDIFEHVKALRQLSAYRNLGSVARVKIEGVDMIVFTVKAQQSIQFLSTLARPRIELSFEQRKIGFVKTIEMCMRQECSDPRDKIYSMLAICEEFSPGNNLIPDYAKDTDRVYIEATEVILSTRQDLLILHLIAESAQVDNLPSWSLNYRSILPTNSVYPLGTTLTAWKFADAPAPTVRVILSKLEAFGECIGTVEAEEPYHDPQASWKLAGIAPICSLVAGMEDKRKAGVGCNLQKISNIEGLWQTLFAQIPSALSVLADIEDVSDLPASTAALLPMFLRVSLIQHLQLASENDSSNTFSIKGALASDLYEYGRSAEVALQRLRALGSTNASHLPGIGEMSQICSAAATSLEFAFLKVVDLNQSEQRAWRDRAKAHRDDIPKAFYTEPKVPTVLPYDFPPGLTYDMVTLQWTAGLFDIMTTLNRFRVFRTDNQLLGLAPGASRGDQLWVLSGAHAPLILRPLPNGNYRYIGGTYMHGLMKGEAIPHCRNPISILIE